MNCSKTGLYLVACANLVFWTNPLEAYLGVFVDMVVICAGMVWMNKSFQRESLLWFASLESTCMKTHDGTDGKRRVQNPKGPSI